LNTEIKNAAAWEGRTDFEYWIGIGDHKADEPGETKVFETAIQFIVDRFRHPLKPQKSWSHYDIYQDFDLWDYAVKSNKNEPGFLYLRNVSPAGFGFYTHKWVPDGPALKNCNATVTTAPLYKKGQVYDILIYRKGAKEPVLLKEKASSEGRLSFNLTGEGCEVSISHKTQPADFVVLNHQIAQNKTFIRVNEKNEFFITLLNRGGSVPSGKKIQLTVKCADPSVALTNAVQEITIDNSGRLLKSLPINLFCTKTPPQDASPPWLKLNVQITCGIDVFHDAVTLPVFYDVPFFSNIQIDDGVVIKDRVMGKGNGNGQVEAGEQVMLYENGRRLRLYTDDPYVETASETVFAETLKGIWPDGYTVSSIVKIADNCPAGHTIEFLCNYETNTHMPLRRDVHWGKVSIRIQSYQ